MATVSLSRSVIEELIYGTLDTPRWTQDSPILPDVWIRYGEDPTAPQDLLLTPHFDSSAGLVCRDLRERLTKERNGSERGRPNASYTQDYVAVTVYFDELIRIVLPMTSWWVKNVWEVIRTATREAGDESRLLARLIEEQKPLLVSALSFFSRSLDEHENSLNRDYEKAIRDYRLSSGLLWMMRIVGAIACACQQSAHSRERRMLEETPTPSQMIESIRELLDPLPERPGGGDKRDVFLVNLNRTARTAVSRSRKTVKADAAERLFNISCSHLTWAIIDSGIDATHPAFKDHALEAKNTQPGTKPADDGEYVEEAWERLSRVRATYDFTRMRDLTNLTKLEDATFIAETVAKLGGDPAQAKESLSEHRRRVERGWPIDWNLVKPLLQIPHEKGRYNPPKSAHGTHVAGILAADWRNGAEPLSGICPDLQLYDLRVLEPGASNDEFAVLAALQFVAHLNERKNFFAIHGANLSLAIRHEVANYACGRTPVCDECERLIAAGVVVVAAAGNEGYLQYQTAKGPKDGYNTVSITDPGNADKVITVGSTHRFQPHTYGVSYFSSRGPTGDGRIKPDLVAPGEKIEAPTPNLDRGRKDGTSMATPHVSGAAAILMSRHSELIGQPARIKEALCTTATDLGRERYFQGNGMLDILRALQSI